MTPFLPNKSIHFIYLLRFSHNFNKSFIFIYLFKSFEFFIFLFFYFPIKMINWRHIKQDIEENNIEENINEDINILEENENLIEENENLIEENKILMLEIERLQNDKFEKIVLIVVSIIFTIIVILKTN